MLVYRIYIYYVTSSLWDQADQQIGIIEVSPNDINVTNIRLTLLNNTIDWQLW
jgi:hypothetical protein